MFSSFPHDAECGLIHVFTRWPLLSRFLSFRFGGLFLRHTGILTRWNPAESGGTRQGDFSSETLLGCYALGALNGLPALQDCLFPILPLGVNRGYDSVRFNVEMECALVVKADGNSEAFGCINNFHEVNDFVPDFGKVCDFGSSCGLVGRVVILCVSHCASLCGMVVRAGVRGDTRTSPADTLIHWPCGF